MSEQLEKIDKTKSITVGDMGLQLRSFDDFQRFATIAVAAGIVGKSESQASAIAKAVIAIQYGAEMGIPPLAALSNVYVINGRPSMAPAMMAAKLTERGYRYFVIQHDENACAIKYVSPKGEVLGTSVFTMKDAKTAGLSSGPNSHNWQKYPRNMLFARCMANGVRWYCSEVFLGRVYTHEEAFEAEFEETMPQHKIEATPEIEQTSDAHKTQLEQAPIVEEMSIVEPVQPIELENKPSTTADLKARLLKAKGGAK